MSWSNVPGVIGYRSEDSVKRGYEPLDESSPTGFCRPPRIAGCLLDYFAAIGTVEDGGKFAHAEAQALLDSPETFFGK